MWLGTLAGALGGRARRAPRRASPRFPLAYLAWLGRSCRVPAARERRRAQLPGPLAAAAAVRGARARSLRSRCERHAPIERGPRGAGAAVAPVVVGGGRGRAARSRRRPARAPGGLDASRCSTSGRATRCCSSTVRTRCSSTPGRPGRRCVRAAQGGRPQARRLVVTHSSADHEGGLAARARGDAASGWCSTGAGRRARARAARAAARGSRTAGEHAARRSPRPGRSSGPAADRGRDPLAAAGRRRAAATRTSPRPSRSSRTPADDRAAHRRRRVPGDPAARPPARRRAEGRPPRLARTRASRRSSSACGRARRSSRSAATPTAIRRPSTLRALGSRAGRPPHRPGRDDPRDPGAMTHGARSRSIARRTAG